MKARTQAAAAKSTLGATIQRLTDRARQLQGVLGAGLIAAETGDFPAEDQAAFLEVALELADDVRGLIAKAHA